MTFPVALQILQLRPTLSGLMHPMMLCMVACWHLYCLLLPQLQGAPPGAQHIVGSRTFFRLIVLQIDPSDSAGQRASPHDAQLVVAADITCTCLLSQPL